MEELAADKIPVLHTEKRYIRKDGSILWGCLRVSTIRDEKGTILYFASQIEDISERKLTGEALRNANKKLNLLSSITRHDINNQLTVMDGYVTLMEEVSQDPTSADGSKKLPMPFNA